MPWLRLLQVECLVYNVGDILKMSMLWFREDSLIFIVVI